MMGRTLATGKGPHKACIKEIYCKKNPLSVWRNTKHTPPCFRALFTWDKYCMVYNPSNVYSVGIVYLFSVERKLCYHNTHHSKF